MKIFLGLEFLILLMLTGCDSNPFEGENKIAVGNRRLQGQVQLSNNQTPANVYVWLEGFGIGIRTSASGFFQFILPPKNLQGNLGVTGGFNIYYFMDNFDLAITRVLINNGEFVYATDEIDKNGFLKDTKVLFQNLRISTMVHPNSVNTAAITVTAGKSDFFMRVDVGLQAVDDSVFVFFPGLVGSTVGPLLFRNTETNEVTILSSTIAGIVENEIAMVGREEQIRTMIVPLFPTDLEPGSYEIIPYLFQMNNTIPARLIESFGEGIADLGPEFIKRPFLRDGTQRILEVRNTK